MNPPAGPPPGPTPPPGGLTRRQLAAQVGATTDMVRNWERAGYLSPSVQVPEGFQRPTPGLYSSTDLAVASVLGWLAQARCEVKFYGEAVGQLSKRARRLKSGWSGWALFGADGSLDALTTSLEEVTAQLVTLEGGLVIPFQLGEIPM